MKRAQFTDADLLKTSIKHWPWLTILFCLLQLTTFLLVDLNESDVAFGLSLPQSSLKRELAFDLLAPGNLSGIPALTSLFVHSDVPHFFTNLPYLLVFSVLLEKRSSALVLFIALISGHLTALMGAALAMTFLGAPHLVLGSSGAAISVAFALLFLRNKKIGGWASIAFSFVLLAISKPLLVSHLPPLLAGIVLGLFLRKKQKATVQLPT